MSSPSSFVAVVTGASSGLGESLARELAARGNRVGLIARRRERIESIANELTQQGAKVVAVATDVANRDGLSQAVETIRQQLGPIDLMIANAGLGLPDFIDPFSVDDIEAMVRVNLLGLVYSVNAVLPEMLARKQGRFVGISSMGAYNGMPGSGGYCGTNAAVNTFLKGLRIQLRGTGVAVTTVCPGFIRTPMTDANDFKMPWLLEPDVAARMVLKAIDRGVRVYNFPWQLATLTHVLQRLPDWCIAKWFPRKTDGR
ncbi:MAG: SDR family NAD(P)-dependent oxidoreductase [Planctomycetaceae bacterium]